MPRLRRGHQAVLDELRNSIASGDRVRLMRAADAVNAIADDLPGIDALRTAKLLEAALVAELQYAARMGWLEVV